MCPGNSVGWAGCGNNATDRFYDAVPMVTGIFFSKTEDIETFRFQITDTHLIIGIRWANRHGFFGHLDDQFHRRAAEIHHVGADAKLTLEAQGIGFHSLQTIPNSCFLRAVLEFQQPVQSSIDN